MNEPRYQLPDRQLADRGDRYLRAESTAEEVSLRWQGIAEILADLIEEVPSLLPPMPCLDGHNWDEGWEPDGGVGRNTVVAHLRVALSAAHAHTGAYHRAADKVGEAILAHNSEVREREDERRRQTRPEPASADDPLDETAEPVSYQEAAQQFVQNRPA